jgi:ribonucleoside-diphosphate reductase alpha chain
LGDGTRQPLDLGRLELLVNTACEDLTGVNAQAIIEETLKIYMTVCKKAI